MVSHPYQKSPKGKAPIFTHTFLFIYLSPFILEEPTADRLLNTNRVHLSQLRGRKKFTPQPSTEPDPIGQAFGGRLLNRVQDPASNGGFGSRTTTDNNIEDD